MNLLPLEVEAIPLAASWLAEEENYRWLDFGAGVRVMPPTLLRLLSTRGTHFFRLFTADDGLAPIGLAAFANIDKESGAATLWYVLGDKRYAGKGYSTRAVAQLLDAGFGELGLNAVNAWVVDGNQASIRVLERNGFRPAGRQRQCHRLDGRLLDRLLFDLLLAEFRERRGERAQAAR